MSAEPLRAELVREVVALQRLVGEREDRRVAERVAAVLGHEVDAHAAGRQVGAERRGVDGDFRGRAHVRRLAADVAAGLQCHRVDAVDGDALIDGAAAVHGEALTDVLNQRAADVVAAAERARNHASQAEVVARARQRVDHFRVQHALLRQRLHVHDRRLARHGDGFLERADAEFDVDGDDTEPVSATPSRLTVLKPANETVTE